MDQIRKLIARRLRAQVAGAHPEPDLLCRLAEDGLPHTERSQLLDHLAACTECREILYLAMPDSAETQKVLYLAPRRQPRFVTGWGTLVASLGVIAVMILGAHERQVLPSRPLESKSPKAAPVAQITEKKAAAELEMRPAGKAGESAAMAATKRPELKHMTAKPQTAMQFDKLSGQVRLQSEPDTQPNPHKFEAPLAPSQAKAPVAASAEDRLYSSSSSLAVDIRDEPSPPAQAYNPQPSNKMLAQDKGATGELNLVSTAGAKARASEFQWTLSPEGALERSPDAGKTWQNVSVPGGAGFRALAAIGTHVWAGGSQGMLFHSVDSGRTWAELRARAAGRTLDEDITGIDFSDVRNGVITTASGAVWKTSDGGESWRTP